MARIRSVHPSLFTDEAFMSISMAARVLWIGLWTEADDHGIFEWKPLTLKAKLLPADNLDVVELLSELESCGLIRRFDPSIGVWYGAISNFCRYQRPKKPKYTHPFPASVWNYTGFKREEFGPGGEDVGNQSPPSGGISPQMEEGGGKRKDEGGNQKERVEGAQPSAAPASNGKHEPETREARGKRLNLDVLPDDWRAFCVQHRPDLKPDLTWQRFRDYWVAKPGKDGRKADWLATWRNWVRAEKGPNGQPAPKRDFSAY